MKWTSGIKALTLDLTKIPIWLHLCYIPLKLFNQDGFSHIASVIGKPLYMDNVTVACKRLAYAKVCVKVDVSTVIPTFVKLIMRDDSIALIIVEVHWYPLKCGTCMLFGHTDKSCPRVGKKLWVPKPKIDNQQKINKLDAGNPIAISQQMINEMIDGPTTD